MNYFNNLNRIEFLITMACTGKCKHCSEGDHIGAKEHIDGGKAAEAVLEACKHYKIESLMTFGGEPLLYPEDVYLIHAAAKEAGIQSREIITNGFFSKDKERIKEVAQKLAVSGVNMLLLSADAFHQETIPLEPVLYFAECVREAGIPLELNPAWLVSREAENPYNNKTREILKQFSDRGFKIQDGNIIWQEGNAKKYLSEYFDENNTVENPYEEDFDDIWTLCFQPNGDVLKGNIYQDKIMEIMESYRV